MLVREETVGTLIRATRENTGEKSHYKTKKQSDLVITFYRETIQLASFSVKSSGILVFTNHIFDTFLFPRNESKLRNLKGEKDTTENEIKQNAVSVPTRRIQYFINSGIYEANFLSKSESTIVTHVKIKAIEVQGEKYLHECHKDFQTILIKLNGRSIRIPHTEGFEERRKNDQIDSPDWDNDQRDCCRYKWTRDRKRSCLYGGSMFKQSRLQCWRVLRIRREQIQHPSMYATFGERG